MHRRDFHHRVVGGTLATFSQGVRAATADSSSFELEEATVADLQKGMQAGKLTARSIAEKYLARIDALDRRGPTLRSVIETNPEALDIAEKLDRERKAGKVRGALHGIPVLIKDNIDTADRMKTTAGSRALAESRPGRDAFVVQRLRAAGAIILGKTNLSEWANIRSSRSTSGWSARGGLTRNPYALDRNPCGSSSGSGVAVAANLAAVAVGTETDGSIVCPASINGIVGIKPTVGLISRAGIIPIAHSQDTAGPMARTVADAAALLGALTGLDDRDPATRESDGKFRTDYTQFLDANGLKDARVGVARRVFPLSEKLAPVLTTVLDVLKKLGAVIIDAADIPTAGQFDDSELEVLLYELKADLNAYLAGLGGAAPVHSLRDVIEFNEKNRDQEMPFFGQDLFVRAEEKGPLTEQEYQDALVKCRRLARTEGIDAVMDKHQLDAIIAVTGGPAWMTDLVNGDHYTGSCSSTAAVAGYPHITVPASHIHGLPVGVSFFGKAYSEPTLVRLAYAFEQATKARRPPRFLPTAELF